MHRKFLLISIFIFNFVLLFSEFSVSQDYWLRQQTPTDKRLTNCFFINNNTGWVTGDSGLIMKSTDSGESWLLQNSNTFHDIISVHFLNERLGWATAWIYNPLPDEFHGTLLLKTTDSGNNWTSQMYPDTNYYYGSVFYTDSLNGFLGGSPQFIVYTLNDGISWIDAVSDSIGFNGYPVNFMTFLNNDTGYASGGVQDLAGLVWKTVNKGRNWAPTAVGPDAVNDIYFFSPDSSIGISGDFKFGASFYRTYNNWLSSFNVNLGFIGMAQSIDFRIRNDGWITIGYLGKLFRSTNAGDNWIKMNVPDSSAIFDIQFTDSAYGWCVGDHGSVYKYNTSMTGISYLHQNEITGYNLYQNYPNPFNPVTKISYDLENNTDNFVTLKVFDVLGNESAVLINEKQRSGRYSVSFNGSSLASGVYFYRLTVNGKFISGRSMLLLK